MEEIPPAGECKPSAQGDSRARSAEKGSFGNGGYGADYFPFDEALSDIVRYHNRVLNAGAMRGELVLVSAGPDKVWMSQDDIVVANYVSGPRPNRPPY